MAMLERNPPLMLMLMLAERPVGRHIPLVAFASMPTLLSLTQQ